MPADGRKVQGRFAVRLSNQVTVCTTVLEKRDSKSRPEAGIVIFEHRGFNQRDELIGSCERSALMFRKDKS